MEWKTVKIADIGDVYSGGTPSSMESSYWNGSLPWLSSGETSQRYIYNTERSISEEGVKHSSTRFAQKGSIVMASAGQGHTRGQVSMLCIDTYVNQSVLVIKPDLRKIDPSFLFFNLDGRYNELRQLSDSASTRGSISGKILKDLPINLPPLETQRRIAAILSSLDDKIENNNRINRNLEAQAQALFKSWFVDFEPWGGIMPEDWKEYELGEFLPVITGKKDANIASKTGTYPFFSCAQDILYTENYSFNADAILVAGNGDFNVKWYRGKFEAYQRTYVLIPNDSRYLGWLYYMVKHNLNNITCGARGSVIKFITKGNLENFRFAAPKDLSKCDIIDKFNTINNTIESKKAESHRLAALRDTLLPKLMKGEIELCCGYQL